MKDVGAQGASVCLQGKKQTLTRPNYVVTLTLTSALSNYKKSLVFCVHRGARDEAGYSQVRQALPYVSQPPLTFCFYTEFH